MCQSEWVLIFQNNLTHSPIIHKTMLWTFAGSSHSKYASYTLEMLCSLELESSEQLKDAIMLNWLVNVQGGPGNFIEGDIAQEHLNNELDESRDHADAEWDGNLMRNIISRNVGHFLRLKKEWRAGLGLMGKSGKHTEPHNKPEIKRLLEHYKDVELHLFRSGRQYDTKDVDDYSRGYNKLAGGSLQKWINDTTRARGLMTELEETEDHQVNEEDDELEEDVMEHTPGVSYMVDGELVVETAQDLIWQTEELEAEQQRAAHDNEIDTVDNEGDDEELEVSYVDES